MESKIKFSTFCEKVVAEMEKKLYGEYEVDNLKEVLKNNGEILTGVVVKKNGSRIAHTIYLDPVYEQYLLYGTSFEECVEKTIALAKIQTPVEAENISQRITDFEYLKQHLFIKVISKYVNEELLKNSIYTENEDLAEVTFIDVDLGENNRGSIRITPELMQELKLTKDEIIRIAKCNNDSKEYSVKSITEVLKDMIGNDLSPELLNKEDDETAPMYVVTNEDKLFGAAILASKSQLSRAIEAIGEDCFIIPSSIHEVLFVPVSKAPRIDELRDMVREVNETQVAPEEVLSNEIYLFSNKNHKLAIAEEGLINIEEMSSKKRSIHI